MRFRLGLSILAIMVGVTSLAAEAQASSAATSLDLLLGNKDYNRLEQALPAAEASLAPDELAYFDAMMANRLNQVELSTKLLEPLVPALLISNVLHAENALCTLADDYAKSFRYSDAATTYTQAATFSQSRGAASLCDAGKEAKRWALLSSLPPQTVEISGPFSLKTTKDSIGLVRVPVVAGNYEGSWIVDTGASLSIISRTVAEQMGLTLLPGSESGEGSSGKFVPVHVALIAELHLGTATLRDVPVLVAEDSDLTFSSLDYKINGCIGLPVLAALGSFTVSRDGSVIFGNATASASNQHNLFLDRLTPVITADLGHGDELFAVDTGAMGTILSSAFYEESSVIPSDAKLTSLQLTGAGGSLLTPAYELQNIATTVAGHCVDIESALLLTEKVNSVTEFHGTIGQSLLTLFESYSLDFRQMQFTVSGAMGSSCSYATAAK